MHAYGHSVRLRLFKFSASLIRKERTCSATANGFVNIPFSHSNKEYGSSDIFMQFYTRASTESFDRVARLSGSIERLDSYTLLQESVCEKFTLTIDLCNNIL